MIKLRLDDSICDLPLNENQKIVDAINTVLTTLPVNRVVTKLNIDGKRYAPSHQSQILEVF